jgi:hypothetical protein
MFKGGSYPELDDFASSLDSVSSSISATDSEINPE